jgi:hypothetical protein
MKMIKPILFLAQWLILWACTTESQLRMNDIQVLGSHNSYKVGIDRALMDILYKEDSALAASLEYEHIPVKDQLDLGLRSLELDIYLDPMGGKYAKPLGLRILDSLKISGKDFDEQKHSTPGMKVFHVQDIDFRSHYVTFQDALLEILAWSNNNPGHVPLIVTINAKDEIIEKYGFETPLPFTKEALDSIDLEIRGGIPEERLITPDLVRGSHKTLEEAILTEGWPLLETVRGKFLFVLDENRQKTETYTRDHPSLKERVMFVNVPPGNPEAGFLIMNNPQISYSRIQELVRKGYFVRTRADANTAEARKNDFSRWEKAKNSGAHVISTDYYHKSGYFESSYFVAYPGKQEYLMNQVRSYHND